MKIKVIVKQPREAIGNEVWIVRSNRAIEKILGGKYQIETIANGSDTIVLLFAENAEVKHLPVNFRVNTPERMDWVYGPAIICGLMDSNLISIPFDLPTWDRLLRRWGNG